MRLKTASALLAFWPLAFAALSPLSAGAQEAFSQVTNISVSPNGELVIQVDGEGFDPMLKLETLPNGEYRIVVQGKGVILAPGINQASTHLGADFKGKIPAIEGATLSGVTATNDGFQLVLTAWRKLQPQISSNSGDRIVISLIGDKSLPPAVLAKRQQVEQQRVAAIKKQAEIQRQIALQKLAQQQHQMELKRQADQLFQAELHHQAEQLQIAQFKQNELKKAEQRNQADMRRIVEQQVYTEQQQAALNGPEEQNSPQDEAQYQTELRQQQQALADRQHQALMYAQTLAEKNGTPIGQQLSSLHDLNQSANVPIGLSKSSQNAVDTNDWKTAYIAPKPVPTEELFTQLQVAQQMGQPTTSKNLAQESSPTPMTQYTQVTPVQSAQPAPESINTPTPNSDSTEDTTPAEPLRLTKPPADYAAPEPEWKAPQPTQPLQNKHHDPETKPAQSPGAFVMPMGSIYAAINQPNADASLRKAWQDLMAGNAIAAQTTLHERLQSAPNDTNARYLLAQILLSPLLEKPNATPTEAGQALRDRREEATQELLKNYAQSLHWPSCQALIELFLDEGKLEEASRILAQAVKAYPHESGVTYEQGRLQEALDDLNAARIAYQQALGLQPANPEIHYRLAQVELKSNHLEAARWELLQGLTWSPNDSRLYKLLGYIADKTGQAPQAAQAYRQALPVDALINYARALETQNEPERALSLYQAVEALAGDNGDILYNLAMIYTNTHRPTRAAAMLNRFLSLNGNQDDARIGKAKSLLKQLNHRK
jgi:Flp pilus assembly protein TadD